MTDDTRQLANSYRKQFIKVLGGLTECGKYDLRDTFTDAVAAMAAEIEKPFSYAPDECEARYQAVLAKHDDKEATIRTLAELLSIVVMALEHRRESFLGPVLEVIGASNVRNGQFLTPNTVANLCARIVAGDKIKDHKPGELVKCYDSSVGAGVMLIHEGEELRKAGVSQRDIFLIGGDIDLRALDICFIELTLLGYSARIEHMNALTLQSLSRPRWTIGYFMYGTQWRDGSMSRVGIGGDAVKSEANTKQSKPTQMELFQ